MEDLLAVIAIEADPATNEHRPRGAPSVQEVAAHVRASVKTWQDSAVGYWVAEHAGEIVGIAGLRPLKFRNRSCWNLYYRFSPLVWGRGFATEAAAEAVALSQAHDPVLPVVARTRPSNVAALRVAERAGLRRREDLDGDGFVVLADGW